MNIAEEINRVIRKIRTGEEAVQVVLEREFDTGADDLWDACTNPKRLAMWFEPVVGDLVVGGRYTMTRSGTEGTILRCDSARYLAITWEYEGNLSKVDAALILIDEDRTLLRVCHHVPPDDHWDTYGPAATGIGWEGWLRALSLYLAGDIRSTPDRMEEFARTPEGQELIRHAANEWASVDQEAGTSVRDAETRAKQTAAFYLNHAGKHMNDGQ